jgi:hypothetical protein
MVRSVWDFDLRITPCLELLGCFVATLLAMTPVWSWLQF